MNLLGKVSKFVIKNAPTICIAIGGIGVVAGTVKACKDTKKEVFVLEKSKKTLKEDIKEAENLKGESIAYFKYLKVILGVYWPSYLVIGGSLAIMVFGHKLLTRRYIALVGAYEALDKSYRRYRSKIREKYGEEEDICLMYDLEESDEEGIYTQADTFIPDRDLSPYSIFWGPAYSILATENAEDNNRMLHDIEDWCNNMLHDNGYLFLTDVYYALGVDRMENAGIGWVEGIGDDFVSFNIISIKNDRAIEGNELVYILDFNHDGCILPYI